MSLTPIQNKLQAAFCSAELSLHSQANFFIVEHSKNATFEKIHQILSNSGFCPFICQLPNDNNFYFTVVPYALPDFFKSAKFNPISYLHPQSHTYFTPDEISLLLEKDAVSNEISIALPEDKWNTINEFREMVSNALNAGLKNILSFYPYPGCPIIEIGSGIGYDLPTGLSSSIIRTQPKYNEALLLKQKISNPVYQLDIHNLCSRLSGQNKHVPLFFALNVFDTMPSTKRQECFKELAQLQKLGDKLIIMLDVNPEIDVLVDDVNRSHPGFSLVPYAKASITYEMQCGVLLPNIEGKGFDYMDYINERDPHAKLDALLEINELKEKLNLKVICFEEFYINQMKRDLAAVGYKAQEFYLGAFAPGDRPKSKNVVDCELIYKSVASPVAVRQWSVDDPHLDFILCHKNLHLPDQYDSAFAKELTSQGKILQGAEILVIEATLS